MSLWGIKGRLSWGVGLKQGEGMSLQESVLSQQGEEAPLMRGVSIQAGEQAVHIGRGLDFTLYPK